MPNGKYNICCSDCMHSNGSANELLCKKYNVAVPSVRSAAKEYLCAEFQPNEAYLRKLAIHPEAREIVLKAIEQKKSELQPGLLYACSPYTGISIVKRLTNGVPSNDV